MQVLITGGSGFIGTNLVERLLREGNVSVVNLDIVAPRNPAHSGNWERCDILDADALTGIVARHAPQFIVHLAARTDLLGATLEDYRVNFDGVDNLITAAKGAPSIERIVFASSMLVCRLGYVPASDQDYQPSTLYGESKVLGERRVRSSMLQIDWTIVRPTSIWGPWFAEPYLQFFSSIISGWYFHIGHRSGVKTFGFVENTVTQLKGLLGAPRETVVHRVFYLGDEPPYSIEEWADEIGDAYGSKIHRIPFVLARVAAKVGDFLIACGLSFPLSTFRLKNMTTPHTVDVRPVLKVIGSPAQITRREGVAATLRWLSEKAKVAFNSPAPPGA